MEYKFGACLPTFASCADRYCLSGYGGGGTTIEEMMELAASVPDLSGIELVGNWHINDDNIERIIKLTGDHGLSICMVTVDLWTQAKWGKGSLAAKDPGTRRAAVGEIKKAMDWAASAGCQYIDVWPGQDGYDYHLQADYVRSWEWLVEGLREAAGHRSDVQLLVEYKPKEPRTHCFVSTVGKAILLVEEVGKNNVRVLLDSGHASSGFENPAESVAILHGRGRKYLAYVHLNDNYHLWDDDMMVGSVHLPELVEMLFWLKKTGYSGWLTLDIFPYREDGVGAATESISWIKAVIDRIDAVGVKKIDEVLSANDGVESVRFLREFFLGVS
jgi:sugar phosphate isomerase/epimerase